jgi:hypothetical protein
MSLKKERDELENMINTSSNSLTPNEPNLNELEGDELQAEPLFEIDFKKIKFNSKKKAKKMIKTATGLVLADGVIAENPYIKQKMDMDIISLSGLLYQLEVNETMQEALMKEVQSGAASPRMFEVFSTQTKAIGELNKQLLQTIEAIKLAYRDVKLDIQDKTEYKAIGNEHNGLVLEEDGGKVSIGTTELIKQAKKIKILSKKMDDSEIEDIPSEKYTEIK